MDKYKAIYLMENGQKMTHNLLSEGEYIYMIDGCIYDENEYKMTGLGSNMDIDFWTDRKGQAWETGWAIYKTDADLLMEANPFDREPLTITNPYPRYDYTPSCTVRFPNEKFISKNSHKRTNKRKKR